MPASLRARFAFRGDEFQVAKRAGAVRRDADLTCPQQG
jgi:hypothetical protein